MGATDGETPEGETARTEERESSMDTLAVPAKKTKKKSPTPTAAPLRDRTSTTPVRGRSQTPFSAYMNRRSATPSGMPSQWRSITPFLKREEKEKTPFELGHDLKAQLVANKMVFDKALVMDITEPEDPPARYITSDISVIDRAAVMDVSNVEVIYLIEEYEDVEPEPVEEVVVTKKKAKRTPRKARGPSTDSKISESPGREESLGGEDDSISIHEDSPSGTKKGTKKKAVKKEKKDKSPSPKLTLKLDLGPPPGSKASKKLFDQPPPAPEKKPPPKAAGKSKLALQMEEQAKKAAAEAAAAAATKPKGETFEEKQKRLKAEAEQKAREEEEERRRIEEEEAAAAAEEEQEPEEDENMDDEEHFDEDEDASAIVDDYEEHEEDEEASKIAESETKESSVESFLRPDPEEEKRWQRIAEEEGEEFADKIRKFSLLQRQMLSEKERDAAWQMRREQARQPKFINFLTDRTAEEGQNIRLVCAVAGPELSVKWYKDGKQLEPGPRYRIINNNNILSLTIINPSLIDSGEYSCLILNPNDEAQSTAIVTIYQVFKDEPSPPMFTLIKDYFKLHDDELTIECHCQGVPRPRVLWKKGGLAVKPSFKFTVVEQAHGVHKLLIYRPSDKDSGLYQCIAINDIGEAEITHNVEFVKNRHWHGRGVHMAKDFISKAMQAEAAKAMEEAMKSKEESDRKYVSAYSRSTDEPLVSPKQKLKIATHLRDRIAIVGSTVKLYCNVVGPDPRIQWLKDDNPISWSSKVRNLSSEGKAVLELKEIENSASGVYKLIAKNDHSEVNTSCYLKVHSAQVEGDESEPMFALPIKDVYHSTENDLIISTKVRGNPRPKISWFKDDVPVIIDIRVQQIEHLDGICELIINKPIQTQDAGNYTCVAENKLGEAKTAHTVAVDNLPTSRRSSVSLSMSLEENRSRRGSTVGAGGEEGKKPKKEKKPEAATGEYERRHVAVPEPSLKEKVYFIANMHNRYVPEGKRCKLQAIIGGPDAQIRWLKDEQNIAYGPKVRNMSSMGMAVLEFVSPTEEDSGEYTLIARNQANEIQTTAILQVYQPKVSTDIEPVFTRALKDTYYLLTHELILETHCRGVPTPDIEWYKDNLKINANERMEIITHPEGTCELIIDKPNKNDSGKYSCRAENNLGKSEVAHYVLFENEAAVVADNIHGVFHADKNLLKKSREVPEQSVEKETKKGKGKAEKEETPASGKEETPAATSVSAKPTKREKKIGIHFPTKLMNRVVAENSKLKLSCFVQSPDPMVKWFHNEEPIAYGPKSKLSFNQGLCSLEIPSASVENSGTYKVVAKDNNGEATTSCKVEVYADPGSGDVAPTFTRGIKDTYIAKTNELILNCHVRGLPQPTIEWIKDGVKLEANQKYQLTERSDGTIELFISNPLPIDSGKYICRAENRLEEVEVAHQVIVEARMIRPISPPRSSEERERTKEPSVRENSIKPSSTREGSTVEGTPQEEKKDKKKKVEVEYSGRRSPPPPPDPKKNLHFANVLANRTVPEGSKVRMSVAIFGPDPQCRWYKVGPEGDIPIAFGPKSKMSCQDNLAVLVLDQLTEEDSGEYKLVARGTENIVDTSCKVLVFPNAKKEETNALVFTVGIKDSYQSHCNQIILDCKLTGNPKSKIYWQKDNKNIQITSDNRISMVEQDDGTVQLLIKNPIKDDTGIYICYAENERGKIKISKFLDISEHVRIQSERKEKRFQELTDEVERRKSHVMEKPEIDTKKTKIFVETNFKDLTTELYNRAFIYGYIRGVPDDLSWYKDDNIIHPSSSKYKMTTNNDGLITLEIFNACMEDSGVYKCSLKNSINEVEIKSNIKIYEKIDNWLPSSFSSSIKESYDSHRNEITLEVEVHGRPKISWLKDDDDITSGRYRQIEEAGGIRKLIIRNPVLSDFGTFVCRAENNNSCDEITSHIDKLILETDTGQTTTPYTNGYERNGDDSGYSTAVGKNRDRFSSSVARIGRDRLSPSISRDQINRYRAISEALAYNTSTFQRDSKRKPVFSTELRDRTAMENSTVRLTCNIMDDGDTDVMWLKNNMPLQPSTQYRTIYDCGLATLEIFSAIPDDSGNYSCVARNQYGESFSFSHLRVHKGYEASQQPLTFTRFIRDNYSLQEDELVLDCRVRGVPRPKIRWIHDSVPIISDDKKIFQLDQADGLCRLIIKSPTTKDSGVYVCEADNNIQTEKTSHSVEFDGKEKYIQQKTLGFYHRDPNKPHFVTPLGNHIVTVGGTIAITAEFGETSTPIDVHWYKDKQPIQKGPSVRTFVEKNAHILAINDVGHDWDGTYTCRASNLYGKIESNANVHISSDAGKSKQVQFLSRPDPEMKILIGDPFSISFRVQGDPKPKLTLMKGAQDITRSERVTKEASDDYTRYTIHDSTAKDSGTYFVVARNEVSTDRIFTTVTVKQRARSATPTMPRWGKPLEAYPETTFFKNPPGPITSQPLVVDAGKHHISLQWGKPMAGDSAPVVAYRIDVWQLGSDGGATWRELGMTPINSYDAFNLKAGSEYHFRVTPRNRYGWGPSVQTSSPVAIGGAECLPEFVKILPGQQKALKDQECVLECVVKGTPRPRIVWYKDGQPIMSTDRVMIKQVGFTCRLRISQVIDNDSGRYTCEASNSIGRVSTFARLQVVSDPKIYAADTKLKKYVEMEDEKASEMIPMFTMRLRDRRVQVTYPVRLTCQVVGYPNPTITWYKDGKEIERDGRFLACDDGQFNTLEISKTSLDDIGTYTATAKNALGSVSCNCNLVVDKGIRAYIAPDFYMPLESVYVFKEGQEIRITAKVEAYPSVGVSWHRNGTRLRPSRKILATLNYDGFVELIIAEASAKDAGVYVCCASNPVGKVESTCRIIIEEATEEELRDRKPSALRGNDMPYSKEPMFVKKPRSSEAYEGDTVILSCEVVGDPSPDVVWLRDFMKPEYYKDAPQFHPVGDGPEYRLEIPSAKLDFTGTYSVIATNCHGQAKAIISLQIYAKDISKPMDKGSVKHGNVETIPLFERRLQDMRCCDGDAITLECNVEAVPEPIIIWEKDGRVLSSTCKDLEMAYDGKKATLTISRVYPEDEGEYTCIAKNNIGRSYSSACVLVDVPEEKENLLSRQLHRPSGFLSTTSTPRSTPRATPVRNVSPLRLSYRATSIDLSTERRRFAAPKFYAIPNGRVVEEGDTVEFQCAIAGHPMPWSTWDKDGLIVSQTSRITIKERDDLRFLEIEDVTFDDAGLYRVTLENDFGRVEATARLDVIAKARYDRSKSTRTVRSSSRSRSGFHMARRIMGPSTRIGGRLALASAFRGSSVPSSKFYHNGVEIEETDRIHFDVIDNHTYSLTIDNCEQTDEGIYTCIAQNEDGIISTTTSVALYDHNTDIPEYEPIIIKELPNEIQTIEGQITDLSFEIESYEPYSYTWYRNDDILLNSDDFRYIDHGNGILTLRIMDTFDLDAGRYSCTVMTKNGSCSTYCDLIVEEDRLDSNDYDLEILKKPQPMIGFQGSIVSFCAKVYPPEAICNWSLCGREICDDSREFSLESQSNGVRILHILGIEYYHSGEIKFNVIHPINNFINLSSYTNLTLLPTILPHQNIFNFENTESNETPDLPVYITKGPKDCTALIGGTIILDVHFGGRPIPKIYWFKAGHQIEENSNIRIETTETKSVLTITSITTDDSGKYTVEIMNEHSSDYAVASVAVEGPPESPSKPSTSNTYDRISIAWCGPPYDGGCMITGFIIEMQENDSEWIEIATVVDSLAYTIKDIKPRVTYKFRVRAENIHGRSEPSKSSDEILVQTQPSDLIIPNGYEMEMRKKSLLLRQDGEFKERFETKEELGKGRFGVVFKVLEKESGQIMAAKVIKCIKARDRVKVQDEIAIMKSLDHPKLLQLAASFETTREIIMIMEYITGGELFERVVADDFTLTERDCILFLRQICEGVDYMHSQSIVHLDLKPENIMCHTRTSHQIKIIDFGLAQRLNSDSPVRVLFGTPEFIAPEIINYEPISFQTDMWSIGVICYVLLSGLSPFMGDADTDTFSNITRADYDFDDEAFDTISQEAKDFISNLLVHRKEDRLTAKECLDSTWLSQYHDVSLINKRICTDKLKKFIIRRKWQKTGNAIRALGRMANLSASRRNSAISNSSSVSSNSINSGSTLSSSPRPSISAGCGQINSLLNPNIVNHMSSVNEEEDDIEITTSTITQQQPKIATIIESKIIQRPKIRNKTECSERSDSGFSECSSCSGGGIGANIICVCPPPILEKPQVIEEEIVLEKINEFSIAVPHDILKTKLEEIAVKHQEMMENELHIEEYDSLDTQNPNLNKQNSYNSVENFEASIPTLNDQNLEKTIEMDDSTITDDNKNSDATTGSKESIMRSDFTNTISMRKKSLETNFAREKSKVKVSKPILGPLGKVSMLKNRFNQHNESIRREKSPSYMKSTISSRSTNSSPVKLHMSRDFSKSKNVFDRLAYNPMTNATTTETTIPSKYNGHSLSLPGSPVPQMRSSTTIRLSNRVREATERLSTPKNSAVLNNSTPTTSLSLNRNKLNLNKQQLNIDSINQTSNNITKTTTATILLKNNNNNNNNNNIKINNSNNISNINSIKTNNSTNTNIEQNKFNSDTKNHDLECIPRNYNTRS